MTRRIRSSLCATTLLGLGLSACIGGQGIRMSDEDRRLRRDRSREDGRTILIPDLKPQSTSKFVLGNDVTIFLNFKNVGNVRSGACAWEARVDAVDAAGRSDSFTFASPPRLSPIDPGMEEIVQFEAISVENMTRPVVFTIEAIVDPPTSGRPQGEVFEASERNNKRDDFEETVF